MNRPLVSVVIIGRNEGPRLKACLRSVQAARWPVAHEVIYIDSGSTDGSVALAAAHGARTGTIERPYSAASARNAGWQQALGDFVLFLDGDTVLDPAFPATALQALEQAREQVAVVWGHRRESDPRQSVYTRALDLDWIFPAGDTAFCGGDALFRRDALAQVGGFDPSLIAGEEPELCHRLRAAHWVIRHIDAPMTRHDLGIRSWRQYWRRCERAGHAYACIGDRLATDSDPLWQAESRRNLVHAAVLGLLLVLPLLAGLALGALAAAWAALASAGLLATLSVRSAIRHRWKAPSWSDALVYGVHSHVQQFPVLAGQLAYWRAARRQVARTLIEYR